MKREEASLSYKGRGSIFLRTAVRACIKRLNIGILFSEPRSHEPDTARRMSDTDLGKREESFLHQKQEKDLLVLPQRSPSQHIKQMCFPGGIR
jgi:hypothetical protein